MAFQELFSSGISSVVSEVFPFGKVPSTVSVGNSKPNSKVGHSFLLFSILKL
jgi:hypothetical protein